MEDTRFRTASSTVSLSSTASGAIIPSLASPVTTTRSSTATHARWDCRVYPCLGYESHQKSLFCYCTKHMPAARFACSSVQLLAWMDSKPSSPTLQHLPHSHQYVSCTASITCNTTETSTHENTAAVQIDWNMTSLAPGQCSYLQATPESLGHSSLHYVSNRQLIVSEYMIEQVIHPLILLIALLNNDRELNYTHLTPNAASPFLLLNIWMLHFYRLALLLKQPSEKFFQN